MLHAPANGIVARKRVVDDVVVRGHHLRIVHQVLDAAQELLAQAGDHVVAVEEDVRRRLPVDLDEHSLDTSGTEAHFRAHQVGVGSYANAEPVSHGR